MTDPQPAGLPYPYGQNPYGHNAYGQGPQIKPLTVWATLAFAAAAATTVAGVVSAALVGHAARTGTGDLDVATIAWSVASLLTSAGLLAGYVTGSFWLYRARSNCDLLFPGAHHARSIGWAWGGWVCPVVLLWFPYELVADVRKAPHPVRRVLPPLVGVWWAFWLMSLLGRYILARTSSAALTSPGDHPTLQAFAWVWAAVLVITLCLWGLVLRRITLDQNMTVEKRALSTKPTRP